MGWNYLSIPKLQQLRCWSFGMNKKFHPTFYNGCNYLSRQYVDPWPYQWSITHGPLTPLQNILIPVWISNHTPSKVWDEITYPLPNFNSCLHCWSLRMNNKFHPTIYNGCMYLSRQYVDPCPYQWSTTHESLTPLHKLFPLSTIKPLI